MARPTNTDARRQEIAKGLMQVMAKKGYDGASIADIAKAARLTPGLVHYHFKDKLEILSALATQIAEQNTNELKKALEGRGPREALEAFIDYYLGLGATANPQLLACWIALTGESLRHKRIKAIVEAALGEAHQLLAAHLERGVAEKVFHGVDPSAVAAALVASVQGYFVLAGTARELIPRGSAARTVKLLMQGLLRGRS